MEIPKFDRAVAILFLGALLGISVWAVAQGVWIFMFGFGIPENWGPGEYRCLFVFYVLAVVSGGLILLLLRKRTTS